jgi:methionyl-tRNA synthetase
LGEPRCATCGEPITFTRTKQLYIAISRLKDVFELLLAERPHWRRNAIAFTRRYLDEGLKDRAIRGQAHLHLGGECAGVSVCQL